MGADNVVNDITTMLPNAAAQEGLKQDTEPKAQAHIFNTNNKVDNQCKVADMTVQKTLKYGNIVQDAGKRGSKAVLGVESCAAQLYVPSVGQSLGRLMFL